MEEIWKDVEGYEGAYQVSSLGRVRSLDRMVATVYGAERLAPGKALSPRPARGYYRVHLCKEGDKATVPIHRLVLTAFVGPCPDGHECNHKDKDRANNRLDNLEWVTHSENVRHAIALA